MSFHYSPEAIQTALDEAFAKAQTMIGVGAMPDFIPALENLDPTRLSVCLTDMNGNLYTAGNYQGTFSFQSISKAILFELALREAGEEEVFAKVGVEPSGGRFNSFYRLELLEKKPSNPFINPGAIAMTSCIRGSGVEDKFEKFRALAAELLGAPDLDWSREVCQCEMETGHRNRALASIMLHNGVYTGDPEEYLEIYYRGCALMTTAAQVSRFGAILANDGVLPGTDKQLIAPGNCRRLRAIMATCGMYDSTGSYAVNVGIPGKSGSGGGIVAIARGKAGLGVYGPELDPCGNSVCGMTALSYLADKLDLRVY